MTATACNDASFGPVSTCRFFDFTLTFQNAIIIISSALIMLISLVQVPLLFRKRTLVQQRRSLFRARSLRYIDETILVRCSLAVIHAAISLALLLLVATDQRLQSNLPPNTILAALSLSTVSAAFLAPFSLLARLKLPNGSFFIPLYLFAGCLIDACRIRTYLGIPILRNTGYTHMSMALLACKGLMLMAENTSGIQTTESTKEGSASFLSKVFFWWLKDVIWTGFRRPLEMVNLDKLPPDFEGRLLGGRLAKVWKEELKRSSRRKSKGISIFGSLQALLRYLRSFTLPSQEAGSDSIELNRLNDPTSDHEDADDKFNHPSRTGPNLLWVCFRAFPSAILAPVFPKICMSGVTLALPFLVRDTLAFAESHTQPNTAEPTNYGWGLVGAYGFVYLVLAISTGQFYWACDKSQVKLRGALLDMIYRKSLRLHLSAARTTGGGAAANLMAVDLERFIQAIIPFHNLWSGLIVVIVATYLLYMQLGWTFVATLVSILICLAFPPIASRGVGGKQARWSKATDARVNLTSSAISNAKGVKFMAYENIIIDRLIEERAGELRHGWAYYKLLLIISCFTNCVTEFMAVSTFSTLAVVDYVTGSHRLTVNLVVTTLTLMQLLEAPLLRMGQNYGSLVAALVSLRRIQDFLAKEETPVNVLLSQSARTSLVADSTVHSEVDTRGRSGSLTSNVAASFQSASIGWSPSKPVLINVTLTIPFNQLTMVCGTLASGKSTLLQSLLGETNVTSGTLHLPIKRAAIAYVAQDGWLQEGATIRDNIIFDAPFDAELYQTVVDATAFHIDLKELPQHDQSLAKSLSGGQRQRLSLARALYAKADSYVLDDFTSALDAETASHVWNSLFVSSNGLLRGKTVIMATNALQLLKYAALIIRLDDGKIVESGSFADLSDKGMQGLGRQSTSSERPEEEREASGDRIEVQRAGRPEQEEKQDDRHEEVERGSVKWSVYGNWFKAIGILYIFVSLAANFAHTGALLGWNAYLQYWGRSSQVDAHHDHTFQWLGGFLALVTVSIVSFIFELFVLSYGALVRAGNRLHMAELKGVFGTSLSFFEDNASGSIINRFSQDLFVLDFEIILALLNFLGTIISLFGSLILLIIPVPYLTAVVIGAAVLYIGFQRLYAPVSRQLRRLEMATKSPIYTLFSETSTPAGLATIRGLNRQELFVDMNIGRLNRSQQPYFYLQAIRRWLQTWMNVLSLIINVALIAIVVLLRNTKSIGVLGAGLVQATQISEMLNLSLVSFTELEIASVAVERVLKFSQLEKEQSDAVNGKMRVKVQPQDVQGHIEFRDVSVAYKAGVKPSLKDLNLTIKSGEKLGIVSASSRRSRIGSVELTLGSQCGRSGSGKSTLLLSIFAMLETSKGEILLDGEGISKMSSFSLRNSLTIVPQNALILTATIRDNLDPSRQKQDSELWNALEVCKLLSVVKAFPDGLGTKLANDINLSAGQRQLFSLARALLRNRKVLVLDEATSSMDYETDAAVQQILRSQFNHCTIITVAHRIATVRDYDRILVLSNGQMVELDTPDALMQQPASIFRALALEQGVH